MSENGVMDRPRRTTRSSLASSTGGTPSTPTSSSNPYKKPTYYSSTRGGDTPVSSRNTNGTTPTSGRGRRGRGRPPGRSSYSSGRGGGGSQTKPECIAVRVDGRRSTGGSTASSGGGRRGAVTGGRRSTYSSRHDYEYHYGSDFDSDQNESEPEEDELVESDHESDAGGSISSAGDNDNAESDSDYSVSSSRVTSSRLPSPPVPIWLDTDKVPELPSLELPSSSDDLLLSREHVVKAVEIYEPLRRFYQLVRLSPFRFEDFCGALACDDQSSLLAEIHIQLLKSVIREEDANGTLFGPNEVKDSVQAIVYFIDYITWPETLRAYLESDPSWKDVYDEFASVEYPFCGPAVRIKVLGWLVDQFLTTNIVREKLVGDGNIAHEDHCRACNRLGELICCDQCPAVYHLECITPPLKDIDNPPDDWKCSVCMKHQVPGVCDCTSEVERNGLLIRHERLGHDRFGRKYWFLVRRLLVESEDGSEVWYYSTRGQVEELLSRLDAENYEYSLVSNIKQIEEELYRHMEITEEVTRLQNTHRRKTYLEAENGKEDAEGAAERMTRLKSSGLYKLGQEGLFRSYVNHYITDPAAVNKTKHNEERDRKRHMSHKFSLTPASECKYGIKDLGGCPRATQISALKGALSHMESALPTTLMHVNWPVLRKSWVTTVQTGSSALDFSKAMIMISACIRNAVYNPVWAESSGHVRFIRMSLQEREEKKKIEKREKKDKDDEEERLKAVPQFIKYTLPIRHQVYKQKGEEYRLHGRWGWLWLSNPRRCKPQDCRKMGLLAGPHKHVIQVKNEIGKVKTMLIDPGVYNKLMAKRNLSTSAASSQSSGVCSGSEPSSTSSLPDSAAAMPTSPTAKTVDLNGESNSENNLPDDKSNCNGDVEMKEIPDEKDALSKGNEIKKDQVEKKADTVDEQKMEDQADAETQKVTNDESQKEKSCDENGKVETVELKTESMEIDTETQGEPQDTQSSTETDENRKVASPKPVPDEVKIEEDTQPLETSQVENMEVDQKSTQEEKAPVSPEVIGDQKSDQQEKLLNGPVSSEETQVVKEEREVEKQEVVTQDSEKISAEPNTETQTSVDSGFSAPPPPSPLLPPVPMTPDKQDDSQGRKFKTELISVSSGLASSHRLLYPKVARRCEYLDSLLHRRLTLTSLEDKQLKAHYGEEMVSKAKAGIAQFLEEEKKLKEEEDEYPGEEVIDPKLTLGGAYSFGCYSSECRKEAILFRKGKGKNRDRIYERICYSPMCRLKFCLQETTRIKAEKNRELERNCFKLYKEIEEKRMFTAEGTSRKVYMKKLPDCLTLTPLAVNNSVTATITTSAAGSPGSQQNKKKKTPPVKYPQTSSFQYATSKKPSILVLPQFELKKLARNAGRTFTPAGFFPNQKPGGWGWPYPCGRPVFRTSWQFRTTHSNTLAAAAMQLKILYASIKWDDIVAKIPNTEGKHQVHTDTEIVTTEILNHRIVGRFMERVQYLRKMMVVPIDAPKTIREITPSRIGLRKRKRAESPDKTEPVVTEDWVDEERLELWEIRFYGDRIDRKHERRLESGGATPSASTRTKSGITIKQPEKYDPSHNPTEKKTYPAAAHHHTQVQNVTQESPQAVATVDSLQNSYDKTIEQVIHRANQGQVDPKISAVKTAERMRETIETEMKMQRAVHLSKRDSHAKNNGNPKNGTQQPTPPPQQTASQQFQQQLQQQNNGKAVLNGANPQQKNIAQVAITNPAGTKVGGVVQKKFFTNRQNNMAQSGTPTTGLDAGILTKRPYQNTITINKGAIAVMKNNAGQVLSQQNVIATVAQGAITNNAMPVIVSTSGGNANVAAMASNAQQQMHQQLSMAAIGALQNQKLSLTHLPDGRIQVKGLLPGQQVFRGPDGKVHVSVSAAQMQQLQQQVMSGKTFPPVMAQLPAPTSLPSITSGEVSQQPQQQQQPVIMQGTNVAIATSSAPSPIQVSTAVSSGVLVAMTSSQSVINTTSVGVAAPVASVISSTPPQIQAGTPITTVAQTQAVVQGADLQSISTSQQQAGTLNQNMKPNVSTPPPATPTKVPPPQQQLQQQQQQQPQVIVQQNGQHIIFQGAAAQALLQQQQQQQKLLQQRIVGQQGGAGPQQQVIKQVVSGVGTATKSPVVASANTSRFILQDGKPVLLANSNAGQLAMPQQQKCIVAGGKQIEIIQNTLAQNPLSQQQQQLIKNMPQIQNPGQSVIVQSQDGQFHLITQHASNEVIGAQAQPRTPQPVATSASSGVLATSSAGETTTTLATSAATSSQSVSAPSTPSTVTTTPKASPGTPTVATPSAKISSDGRTIFLSPSQLNELQLAGGIGGRKVLVNNKIIQLPAQPSPVRGQQILQTLAAQIQPRPTVQIVQGPGGQQFLIHQTAQPTAVVQQPQQQQQVQIVMSSDTSGGQPVIVKKVVKSPAAGVVSASNSPGIISKSGNVLQIAANSQNQLTQFLTGNKTLVRLDNNQIAAIQLPVQQTASSASVAKVPTSMSDPTTQPQPQQSQSTATTVAPPAASVSVSTSSTSTPASAPQPQIQPQGTNTTITKTPGLPISIVSPSKAKTQQQQTVASKDAVQVIPTSQSASGASPAAAVAMNNTPPSPVPAPQVSKQSTVIRLGSPTIPTVLRGPSASTTVLRTSSPAPRPAAPSPKPPAKPVVLAHKSAPMPIATASNSSTVKVATPVVASPVIAVKSAPPAIPTSAPKQISTYPNAEVKPQEVESTNSASAPAMVIARKSEPPPVQNKVPLPPVNASEIVAPSSLPKSQPSPTPNVAPSPAPVPTPTIVPTPSAPAPAPVKAKATPSKIVAQIFQTPQGPKVVIQGVNPSDLTPNQMMQLQAQIQKQLEQLTTQQQQKEMSGKAAESQPQLGVASNEGNVEVAHSQEISQSPATIPQHLSNAALHASPIETLRSGPTTPVSHSSALTSPVLARSPPLPAMVSPAKVLSPPPNLPNVLSKTSGFSTIPVNNSVAPQPAPAPIVVARKSQSRKSPIRPNNIDSPPRLFSTSSPTPIISPPPLHNSWNNDAAAELMRPLNTEQQQILSERRNALKEDIMEKKKQAATQLRLEREMKEKMERARIEEEAEKRVTLQQVSAEIPDLGPKGAKKRKSENMMEGTNSRSVSESSSISHSHMSHLKKGPRGKGRKRKLLCVCKTPYDKDRFYVGCDKCQNWFHGECIGITEEMSRDLPEYICDECRDDKLYCFCRKPYNESQFYIQCDKCDDWFHGRCVGVLQGESESIGDYSCPTCEPESDINRPNSKKLDASDYMSINRLLKELLQNRASIPFRKPVSKSQAPNYYAVIKEPMDLQTVGNRVEDRQYEHLRDFVGDVGKIFENCRYFNDASTDIYRHADNLEKFFVQKVCALRQSINNRARIN